MEIRKAYFHLPGLFEFYELFFASSIIFFAKFISPL